MDSWAKQYYNELNNKKILPTIMKTDLDYTDNISRIEFTHLMMLYLMSNKNYSENIPAAKYSDVNDNYVNLASHLKIISGYSNGTFKPFMPVTRSEAAVIVYNTEKQINSLKKGDIKKFKDYKFIPSWATESLEYLSSTNIINGYPDKMFSPSKKISRQEAIAIVYNMSNSKKTLKDAYNISKTDEYLTKERYDFVLSNIPSAKFNRDVVKENIFKTAKDKRVEVYSMFLKTNPYSSNDIMTSPNLIFTDSNYFYILGLERRNLNSNKKEQRTFMMKVSITGDGIDIDKQKEFSPWYTVEK
ncbi:hypothetical protein HMPREF0379_1383 [[Eubacterium] yurii subsp. margaretiae ATCC 43715]|nr:hypothetical protein HMPREF0379_1383 [[Eubacterium] yurii subsp. margaretiae ATCC 43715]